MTLALIMLLIICTGDVETNQGPKKNTKISYEYLNTKNTKITGI